MSKESSTNLVDLIEKPLEFEKQIKISPSQEFLNGYLFELACTEEALRECFNSLVSKLPILQSDIEKKAKDYAIINKQLNQVQSLMLFHGTDLLPKETKNEIQKALFGTRNKSLSAFSQTVLCYLKKHPDHCVAKFCEYLQCRLDNTESVFNIIEIYEIKYEPHHIARATGKRRVSKVLWHPAGIIPEALHYQNNKRSWPKTITFQSVSNKFSTLNKKI